MGQDHGMTHEITQAELLQTIGLKQMLIEFQAEVIATLQARVAELELILASAGQAMDTASDVPVLDGDDAERDVSE